VESLVLNVYEMLFVTEEDETYDAPHVVDEVGIIELHAPTFRGGRETTQHKQPAAFGEERFERVMFYG